MSSNLIGPELDNDDNEMGKLEVDDDEEDQESELEKPKVDKLEEDQACVLLNQEKKL